MPRRIRSWRAWLLPALLLVVASPALAGAPRLALVVGEAAYPARPPATVGNDAALVAQALAQAGFEVSAAHDLDAQSLRAALAGFVDAARTAGPEAVLVVYLAGYGVQYDGGNFLVPVDARLIYDDDVPAETASLDDFIRALAAVPAKARVVAVDASRAQPYATADEMPLAPGLGLTTAPAGTLVGFAAAPGMVAPDDAPPYGAYARALAEMIAVPGLAPGYLLDRVRLRVGELTDGEQVPWDDGALADGVALTPAAAPVPPTPQVPPPGGTLTPDTAYSVVIARDALASDAEFLRLFPDGPLATRIRVLQAVRREATMWQAAAASDDPRADWTYMRRYPRGPHRFDARRRLAALHAALEPPPRFDVFVFPALPPPPAAELPLVAAPEQALRGLPPIPPPPAALLPPPDPAYYDELPMPAPAPPGLLPIAPPLPGTATGEPARVTQARPDHGACVAETRLDPDGSAAVTLADATGPLVEVAAGAASAEVRTLIETGPTPAVADAPKDPAPPDKAGDKGAAKPKPAPVKPEPPVLSRTTVTRTAAGVTITQLGPDRGTLLDIATRADADGGRTTRVTGGGGTLIAAWRRDPQGIVIARDVGPATAPAPDAAPAPRPTSPSPSAPPPKVAPVGPAVTAAPAPTPSPAPRPIAPAPVRPPSPPAEPATAPAPMLPKLAPPASQEPSLATPPTPVPEAPAPSTTTVPVPPAADRAPPPMPAAPLPPRRPGGLAPKPEPARNKVAAPKPAPARKPAPPRRPAPRRSR